MEILDSVSRKSQCQKGLHKQKVAMCDSHHGKHSLTYKYHLPQPMWYPIRHGFRNRSLWNLLALIVTYSPSGTNLVYIRNTPVLLLALNSLATPCTLSLVKFATVPDHHFSSGSGSNLIHCDIGNLGCQYSWTVHSGIVWRKTLNLSQLGGLSTACLAGPAVDSNNAVAFELC